MINTAFEAVHRPGSHRPISRPGLPCGPVRGFRVDHQGCLDFAYSFRIFDYSRGEPSLPYSEDLQNDETGRSKLSQCLDCTRDGARRDLQPVFRTEDGPKGPGMVLIGADAAGQAQHFRGAEIVPGSHLDLL